MPPKPNNSKPAAAAGSSGSNELNFSLSVSLVSAQQPPASSPNPDDPLPPKEGYRVRVFSKSISCAITSPIFGDRDAFPWENIEGTKEMKTQFQLTFDVKSIESPEHLAEFHKDPYLYIAVFYVTYEGIKISDVIAMDVSIWLIESKDIVVQRPLSSTTRIEIELKGKKTLSDWKKLLPLQPVLFKMKNINNFPRLENEPSSQSIRNTYIYSRIELAPGLSRPLISYPSLPNAQGKHQVQQTFVLLPGLGDLPRFNDLIASYNFALELFDDDFIGRAFPEQKLKEYYGSVGAEPQGLQLPDTPASAAPVVAPTAGKKGAGKDTKPAAKAPGPSGGGGGEGKSVITVSSNNSMSASDQILYEAITAAYSQGKRIRSHGSMRFRLEGLLDRAADLLNKFKMKSKAEQIVAEQQVVVKEEMALEVRLEKPSHPEKWDLPSDLSLLSALQRAKASQQAISLKKAIPRHELFLSSQTSMAMTVEMYRKLDDNSKQIDSDVLVPIKQLRPRDKKDADVTEQAPQAPQTTQVTKDGKKSTKKQKVSDSKVNLSKTELEIALEECPFTRIIINMKYNDDEMLRKLNDGINEINAKALPNIQGSIRSYSLTPQELEAAKQAKLDVLSGFMIIDDDVRLIVLEGMAKPNGAIENLYIDYLFREQENTEALTVLCNPTILFPERGFAEFSPDLRRIRVRGKLSKLARRPEVYNRQQVEELCFQAIDNLMALRRAQDLRSTKILDMYPSAESLNQLELLYGEAISRADMDGSLKIEFIRAHESRRSRREKEMTLKATLSPSSKTLQTATSAESRQRSEYEPTDCRNPQFEEHLRTRPAHRIDYLAEQRQLRREAYRSMLYRRDERNQMLTQTIHKVLGTTSLSNVNTVKTNKSEDEDDEEGARPSGTLKSTGQLEDVPKIYLYSHQRENFKAKMWDQLRQKVAADTKATYTFSQDFVSQTVCPVDLVELQRKEEAEHKQKMMTKKGFLYPKPKTRKELITHPQRPSDARIEDLKEPFSDVTDVKKTYTEDPVLRAREFDFHSQTKSIPIFGALQPPEFEHEFQLKLIGNRESLPRGRMVGGSDPNPAFFKSVHLGGDDQAKIVEEALAKEKEEWQSKVIVDTLDFKVGGMKVRDKPIQMDRSSDILHDEPKRDFLKHIRDMHSHRGKDISYHTTPLSILSRDPFKDNQAANALVRTADPSKFVTAALSTLNLTDKEEVKETTEKPLDFKRYIHPGTNKSKIITMVAKRTHPPLEKTSAECTGPKWQPPNSPS